jgi:hypothetical protein
VLDVEAQNSSKKEALVRASLGAPYIQAAARSAARSYEAAAQWADQELLFWPQWELAAARALLPLEAEQPTVSAALPLLEEWVLPEVVLRLAEPQPQAWVQRLE